MARSERVLTTLEKPLYQHVVKMAERDEVTLSQKIRDMIRASAEMDEDADLLTIALGRKHSGAKLLSHSEFWTAVEKRRKKKKVK